LNEILVSLREKINLQRKNNGKSGDFFHFEQLG